LFLSDKALEFSISRYLNAMGFKGAVSKQNEFLRQSPFFNLKSKQAKVHKKLSIYSKS